ncbi:hypothetical protein DB347_23020 [Opitutaceae bacterium EW11]|nr:hypothetical protein DB347_23020 [Opitutaceae bacterium EW11]
MKVPRLLVLLAPALVALGAEPRVEFTASAPDVACYDFIEIAAEVGTPTARNPFTDAVLEGTFHRAGHAPVVVDGFCDSADGRVFRIRFMPAEPGNYEYALTYRDATGTATRTGTFTARDERKRGIVRIDPEYPAHFQYQGSKERFFWNGTTAFWLAGWDDGTLQQNLDRLDRLKVTRVRAALAGRVQDAQAWPSHVAPGDKFSFRLEPWLAAHPENVERPDFDVTRFNVAYWQKWERLLAYARAVDMAVSVVFYVDGSHPGVDPFGKAGMGGADEQRYYRYAVARLGAYCNVMWDVADDYRQFRDDAWADQMGRFLKKCDPYGHLTSLHGQEDFRFRTAPWADFAMYQRWDESGGYDFMLKNRLAQEQTGRLIPQVNEEYGYEDWYPKGQADDRVAPARAAATRARIAWQIYLAGGYQTTGERADSGPGGWVNGGGDDTLTMLELYGHMYDFFTGIRWWELRPDTELVVKVDPLPGSNVAAETPRSYAARNPAGDLAAIYVRGGGIVALKGELLKDQLKPLWFSPRDGGMRNARAMRNRVYRTPTADDWVLLFRTPCNCSFRDFDNELESNWGERRY